MDQTIGIEYQVTGADAVVRENAKVIQSFSQVDQTLKALTSSLASSIGVLSQYGQSFKSLRVSELLKGSGYINSSSFETAANRTEHFKSALEGLIGAANRSRSAIDQLTSTIGKYAAAVSSIPSLTSRISASKTANTQSMAAAMMPPLPIGGKGGGKGGDDFSEGLVNSFLGNVPWFMLRWRLFSGAIEAAEYSIKDILLGRARQDLAEALGELSAVAFNSVDKKKTEIAAQNFSQSFWNITATEYIKAMSQTASALNIREIGFENLQRMNESVLQFSLLSKMKPEPAAEFISKTMSSVLAFQGKDVQEALNKGQKAYVKGYGEVDIGDLASQITAQMAKTIQISNIWGPGIAGGFKYALPGLLNLGWDIPSASAFLATLVDLGFKGEQSGRAIKDIIAREPQALAKLLLMGAGRWVDPFEYKQLELSDIAHEAQIYNESSIRKLMPTIQKMMQTPEGLREILTRAGKAYESMKAKGIPIKDIGLSQYFLQIIETTMKETFWEKMEKARETIQQATPGEMAKQAAETLEDAGTAYQRIANSVKRFFAAVADHPIAHTIASPLSAMFNLPATILEIDKLRGKMSPEEMEEEIKKAYPLWKTTYGENVANILSKRARGEAWFFEPHLAWTMSNLGLDKKSLSDWTNSLITNDFWIKEFIFDFEKGMLSLGEIFKSIFNIIDDNAKMVNDFWREKIHGAFNALGETLGWVADKASSLAATLSNLLPWNWFSKGNTDQLSQTSPPVYADVIPQSYQPLRMPMMPEVVIQQASADMVEQSPNVQVRVFIDEREIRNVVAEAIAWNRTTSYHGFGGDPMGFDLGVV